MKWHERTTRRRGDLGIVDQIDLSRAEELSYYRPFQQANAIRTMNGSTKRGFWFRRYYRP